MTNEEKIRSMSFEELAEFIGNSYHCKYCAFEFAEPDCFTSPSCGEGVGIWLKREAEE